METLQIPNSKEYIFYTLKERIPQNFEDIVAILRNKDDDKGQFRMLSGEYRRYKTVPDKFFTLNCNYEEQYILLWTPSELNIK